MARAERCPTSPASMATALTWATAPKGQRTTWRSGRTTSNPARTSAPSSSTRSSPHRGETRGHLRVALRLSAPGPVSVRAGVFGRDARENLPALELLTRHQPAHDVREEEESLRLWVEQLERAPAYRS